MTLFCCVHCPASGFLARFRFLCGRGSSGGTRTEIVRRSIEQLGTLGCWSTTCTSAALLLGIGSLFALPVSEPFLRTWTWSGIGASSSSGVLPYSPTAPFCPVTAAASQHCRDQWSRPGCRNRVHPQAWFPRLPMTSGGHICTPQMCQQPRRDERDAYPLNHL